MKKYEFTGETNGNLKRIRALVDIPRFGVKVGDLGGWIEDERNLSHKGDAWVSGNAQVFGNARVFDNAWVYGDARVYGGARVYGDARVTQTNITAVRSDNYTFSVVPTPEGPRICAGCRYFSFEEARAHWTRTRGGTVLGDESLMMVDYLEAKAKLLGMDEIKD